MRLLLLAAALLLAALACRRPDGPAERYRAFSAAARAGDAEAVWSMLAARSRAAAEERARALAAAAPGVVSGDAKSVVLGSLAAAAAKPRAVVVSRESQDAAVLSVEPDAGGPPREVTLVREGGAWRVVVPFDK